MYMVYATVYAISLTLDGISGEQDVLHARLCSPFVFAVEAVPVPLYTERKRRAGTL